MVKAIKILILKNRLSNLKSSREKSARFVYKEYSSYIDESAEDVLPEFFEELDDKIDVMSRLIDIMESK